MSTPELLQFLHQLQDPTRERLDWPGNLSFIVSSYITPLEPPDKLVTSVRALVLRGDRVLVVIDHSGSTHILPGGRIEAGEERLEALAREVLEESGWAIKKPVRLGVRHLHHLQPMPAAYAYPYPDFLQDVYVTQATELFPEAREVGGFEIECRFLLAGDVVDMPLTLGEQAFLQAALEMYQAAR